MSASVRRHAAVAVLILATVAAGAGLSGQAAPPPTLPAAGALTAGASWQVETAFAPGDAGGPFRQWLLRDPAGTEALLYVGATSRVQTMARWTGELGYQGEGYLVTSWPDERIGLAGGSSVAVRRVLASRQGDQRLLEYAVVGPEGVTATATASLPRAAWDSLSGRAGPYYLVRVAVPPGDAAAADRLLAVVLPPLLAAARRA